MAGSPLGGIVLVGLAVYIAFVVWLVAGRNAESRHGRPPNGNLRTAFVFLTVGVLVVGLIATFFLDSIFDIGVPLRATVLIAVAAGAVGVVLARRAAPATSSVTADERPLKQTSAVGDGGSDAARLHSTVGVIVRTVLAILNAVTLAACVLTSLSWPVLPDGRFDDDADEATLLLVVFAALIAMATGVLTAVAVRTGHVRRRWLAAPLVLLAIAVAIGAGVSMV